MHHSHMFNDLPTLESPDAIPWEEVLRGLNATTLPMDEQNIQHVLSSRKRRANEKLQNSSSINGSGSTPDNEVHKVTSSNTICQEKRRKDSCSAKLPPLTSKFLHGEPNDDHVDQDGVNPNPIPHFVFPSQKLSWRGKAYILVEGSQLTLPHSISEPIPIRIHYSAITQLPHRPSRNDEGEWLLGLAIYSYVQDGRREVMYVVLLDDGHEIHIPRGQVEHILLSPLDGDDMQTSEQSFSRTEHLQCHPSSLALDDGSNDSSDATDMHVMAHFPHTESRCTDMSLAYTTTDDLLPSEFAVHRWPSEMAFSPFDNGLLEGVEGNTSTHSLAISAAPQSWPHIQAGSEDRLSPFTSNFQQVLLDSDIQNEVTNSTKPSCFSQSTFTPTSLLSEAPTPTRSVSILRGKAKASSALPIASTVVEKYKKEKRPRTKCRASTSMPPVKRKGLPPRLRLSNNVVVLSLASEPPPLSTKGAPPSRRFQLGEATKGMDMMVTKPTIEVNRLFRQQRRQRSLRGSIIPPDDDKDLIPPLVLPTGPDVEAAVQELGIPSTPSESAPAGQRHGSRGPRPGSRAAMAAEFRRAFSEATWTTNHSTYIHDPVRFSGPLAGPSFPCRRMPSKLILFGRFWTEKTLAKICQETNRYASEADPETGLPLGGPHWWALSPMELRAYLGISLLMGIKRLPSHRSYWKKEFAFLYCHTIANTMSRARFEDLTRCLHVCDDSTLDNERVTADALKLAKLGWLLAEMQEKFKLNWNLNQEICVDESMIRYKGKYYPIKQYIPKKSTKWGIKVWALADAKTKYVYDFDVYTGAQRRFAESRNAERGAKSGYEVVMLLLRGLHGRGHVVVTDCFFSSVKLTVDLAALGTYATGTVMSNRVGLPKSLAQKQNFASVPQGTISWRMHNSRKISYVVWVDRKAVLLVSSFFTPLPRLGEPWPTVPRWVRGVQKNIETSPVHKGYTTFMRGVDVVDQMRGTYSSQTRSQKWWH